MSDYNISAYITANTSGYESGIKKAQKASKSFSKTVSNVIQGLGKNGLVGALGAVGLATNGFSAVLGTVSKVAKKVSQTITECTEAYKGQAVAERALETAMQNNPFTQGKSAQGLKEFASAMQKVSNYGDEELIPFMTQLIASGRTEAETMKIIKTATDIASTGAMSFDTAVTQLNATLNGNVGRLGQQNAELKSLTAEELKAGKAVDILAEKYSGMAKASIDTSKQLKNIRGDFKEVIGQFTMPASDTWNKFWAGFYDKGIKAVSAISNYLDQQTIGKNIASQINQNAIKLGGQLGLDKEDILKDVAYVQTQIENLNNDELQTYTEYLRNLKNRTEGENMLLRVSERIIKKRELDTIQQERQAKIEAEKQKILLDQENKEKTIIELKEKYLQKIEEQKQQWTLTEQVTGEVVSNEEKQKFYQEQLIAIMTEAGGKITENNQYYKDQMAIIQSLASVTEETVSEISKWDKKLLQQKKDSLNETSRDYHIVTQRIIELERQEALQAAKTAQEKAQINQYYNSERENEAKRFANIATQSGEQAAEGMTMAMEGGGDEITATLKAVGEVCKKVFQGMIKVANATAKVIKSVFEKLKQLISKIMSSIKSMASGIGSFLKKIGSVDSSTMLDSILKFEDNILTFFIEVLPKLPGIVKSAFGSILVTIEQLLDAIDLDALFDTALDMASKLWNAFSSWYDRNKDKVKKLVDKIAKLLTEKLPSLVDKIGKTLKKLLPKLANYIKPVLQGVLKKISSIFDTNKITNFISGIITAIANNAPTIFGPLLSMITSIINGLINSVSQNSGTIISAATKMLQQIVSALKSILLNIVRNLPTLIGEGLPKLIDGVLKVVLDIIEALPEIIRELIPNLVTSLVKAIPHIIESLLKALPDLLLAIPKFWLGLIEGIVKGICETDWTQFIKDILNAILNAFGSLKQWFEDKLVPFFKDTVDKVKNIFKELGDFVKNIFSGCLDGIKSVLNGAITVINTLIKGLNKIPKVNIPTIPYLANGTLAAKRGYAIVGEAGPELVKFNGGEQVINNRNTQKALNGMGQNKSNTFNVTFNNTQDTTAFALMQQLKQYQRQMAFNGVL